MSEPDDLRMVTPTLDELRIDASPAELEILVRGYRSIRRASAALHEIEVPDLEPFAVPSPPHPDDRRDG